MADRTGVCVCVCVCVCISATATSQLSHTNGGLADYSGGKKTRKSSTNIYHTSLLSQVLHLYTVRSPQGKFSPSEYYRDFPLVSDEVVGSNVMLILMLSSP